MTKTMDRVKKDEDRQAKSLEELEQGAEDIAERKKEAAGMSPPPRTDTALITRGTAKAEPGGRKESVESRFRHLQGFVSSSTPHIVLADSQAISGEYHGGN
jgi:hypothetical protein